MSVADWAQVLSALAASAAALFAAFQLRESRRLATVQSLQRFYQDMVAADRALQSVDPEAKTQAVIEYLNLLEFYAALYNASNFSGPSKELVGDQLIDAAVEFTLAPEWHATIEDSVTSERAFLEWRKFISVNRSTINARLQARERLATVA